MAEKKLWAAFRELSERLSQDRTFSATFDRDPSKALREGGFDITVPATTESSPMKLSDLLQRMTAAERRATIDAIVGNRAERPDRVAVVTPIANANALVNVNAVENANAVTQANALAIANANANTTPMAPAPTSSTRATCCASTWTIPFAERTLPSGSECFN